jgi:hypothetical protein
MLTVGWENLFHAEDGQPKPIFIDEWSSRTHAMLGATI